MTKIGTIKKYLLILRFLETYPVQQASLQRLQAHFANQGFEVSAKTLKRGFDELQREFGVQIKYDKKHNGYELFFPADEDLADFKQLMRLLELAERNEALTQTFQAIREASKVVIFEQNESFQGFHWLGELVGAIRAGTLVEIEYRSFTKLQAQAYELEPHLLTEYRNRWYLIGVNCRTHKVQTFGLDRVIKLLVTKRPFTSHQQVDYKQMLNNTFGITCLPQEPERIVLSFSPQQGLYLQSLRLHHSQQELINNKQEYRIALTVVLNYEIKKEILSYGPDVEVLEPASLREEIREKLVAAQKKYVTIREEGQILG